MYADLKRNFKSNLEKILKSTHFEEVGLNGGPRGLNIGNISGGQRYDNGHLVSHTQFGLDGLLGLGPALAGTSALFTRRRVHHRVLQVVPEGHVGRGRWVDKDQLLGQGGSSNISGKLYKLTKKKKR